GARAGAMKAGAGPSSTPGARSACRGGATATPSASWARSIPSGWGRGGGRDGTAVSIVGSLDPERLEAALEGTGDGLAARFLYVWPGPAPYRSLRIVKPVREDEAV